MDIKNLGQLVQVLATKAGIDNADMHLVNVLSNSELSRISLHGDIAKSMSENLLSLEEAKSNHPQIGNVYKAQALNGFDKKMDEVAAAAGLDEATMVALKGVKNSYKRFEMLVEGIQNSKAKSQKDGQSTSSLSFPQGIHNDTNNTNFKDEIPYGNDKGDGVVTDTEDTSNSNASTTSNNLPTTSNNAETYDQRIAELQALRKQDRVQYELRAMLVKMPTIYDELPVKARHAALNAIIKHALQESNAAFDFDEQDAFTIRVNGEGNGANTLLGEGVMPQLFIDMVLAQNKILRVAMPQRIPGNDESEGKAFTPRTITANPNGPQGHNQVASLNRRMREQAGQ